MKKDPRPQFYNPFLSRPWMTRTGAAASEQPHGSVQKTENKGLKGIFAGGITGGIEVLVTYPTEYVKTQLQLDEKHGKREYDGIADCIKKTVRKHGFFGLYRGLSVLLYGSMPKTAVRFGSFETFKSYMLGDSGGVLSPTNRMICGLGAGVCEALAVVTPMETVKVKFIHDRRSPKPMYKGFLHGVGMIVRNEGLMGLYQGVTATVMKQSTNQGIRFFTMETLRDIYTKGNPDTKVPKYVIGMFGLVAGAISVIGNTPLDVVKTRMQGHDASKYKHTLDCIIKVWKHEGIAAFYKGTVPRMCRVCLDVALTFSIYESLMELINKFWP